MSVEEPAFRLRLREGRFELRDYPSLVVAEVVVAGDQKTAASAGFRSLAGYIFGGNARGERIAMTAPVTQSRRGDAIGLAAPLVRSGGSGGEWVVSFTMPRTYALGALPPPKNARVRLRATPATRYAVIRFSGTAQPNEVEARAAELGGWVEGRGLRARGGAALAQYDPPWTPWFLRRNEVLIPLAD